MDNLAVFEWEKDELIKLDKDLIILPGHSIKYKSTDIVLYWGIQKRNGKCPFLSLSKLSKCNIYEKRPLVCRAYPLFHSGFKSTEEVISVDCPESIIPFSKNEKISKLEFYKRLKDTYADSFLNSFRLDLARIWVSEIAELTIQYLEENEIDIDEKEIGLFELALREGIITEEEYKDEVNSLLGMDVDELIQEEIDNV
jgi:Fe-S-cluster containining protein